MPLGSNAGAREQSYSTGASSRHGTKSAKKISKLPLKILYFSIIVVIISFIFANIKPYEQLASMMLGTIEYPAVAQALYNTPIIGGIIKFFANFLSLGVGTAFWAIVQILEVLPLLLFGHGRFLNNQISRHGNSAKYAIAANDGWETKAAKFLGNSLSTETMRFLVLMAIGVYVADFLLLLMIYPPIKGDFGDFLFIIQTAQWDKINWLNLVMSIWVLFAVEFLLKLSVVVREIIEDLN